MPTSSEKKSRSSENPTAAQGHAVVMAGNEGDGREQPADTGGTVAPDATTGCIPIVSVPGSAGSGSVVTCQISVQPAPQGPTLIAIDITPANAVMPYIKEMTVQSAGPFDYPFQLVPGFVGTVTFSATIGTSKRSGDVKVS